MIQIKHLNKSYGNEQVLYDITMQFEKGKAHGIVGENGAGKTTLFKCITGLESYDGSIISDIHPLKNYIGYLATQPYFLSRITGKEYLRLHCNARSKDLPTNEQYNIFDLPLDRYATQYSSGMQKKLALTAILLQKNEIYILDEPYNGVDIQSNILITEIIHKLKSINKTVIISSHIFSTLNDTCDEISVLKNGQIAKHILPSEFAALDTELKENIFKNRVNQLDL